MLYFIVFSPFYSDTPTSGGTPKQGNSTGFFHNVSPIGKGRLAAFMGTNSGKLGGGGFLPRDPCRMKRGRKPLKSQRRAESGGRDALRNDDGMGGSELTTYNLKRFSNAEALEAISREHLLALLIPYASYFNDRGLTLPPQSSPDGLDYEHLVQARLNIHLGWLFRELGVVPRGQDFEILLCAGRI
jgi:hypothetical protein